MNLGLDYDGTYNSNTVMFKDIIRLFQSFGHKVYLTTLRVGTLDAIDAEDQIDLDKYGVEVIYCDGKSKREVTESQDIKIDWWLDDWPDGIINGSDHTPEETAAWLNSFADKADAHSSLPRAQRTEI